MNISEYDRNTLEAEYNVAKDKYSIVRKELVSHIRNVFDGFINNSPVLKDICFNLHDNFNTDYFEIRVKKDNTSENYNGIDISIRRDYWRNDNDDSKIPYLSMNYCCFGSFRHTEIEKINYVTALGMFASNLENLEKKIQDFDWKSYYEVESDLYSKKNKLECYDSEVEHQKRENKKNEFLKKLIVGTKIIIGDRSNWNSEKNKYERIPDVRTIERVGKKTINISNMWNRVKKEDALNYLVDNKWKFEKGV